MPGQKQTRLEWHAGQIVDHLGSSTTRSEHHPRPAAAPSKPLSHNCFPAPSLASASMIRCEYQVRLLVDRFKFGLTVTGTGSVRPPN